jgi:pentose-5-phosphate-3-epimerase
VTGLAAAAVDDAAAHRRRRGALRIAEAGADTFVAGSAIFNTPNYEEVIQKMRAELALARP